METKKEEASNIQKRKKEEKIRIGIVGSREFNNQKLFDETMSLIKKKYNISTVVTGGARGADQMAINWANKEKIQKLIFLPSWKLYQKRAGIIRNGDIINHSDFLIAFWNGTSPGTKNSIERAKKKDIPIQIIYYTKS